MFWAVLIALVLAGCARPVMYSTGPFVPYDKDTAYHIADRPGGFTITVTSSRYQSIPETGVIAVVCKSALTSLAHEVAEQRSKKIHPINEQRIQFSVGRNVFSGVTACSATAPVDFIDSR